jgi:hypothetical protein
MNRELLAAVLFAMATIGVVRAEGTNNPAEAAKSPPPKIRFDKTVYDFGPTSLVESVTGTFTFQNVGAGELKISKPQPSCGCTVAGVKPDVLKPGEKGELVFTVRVGGQRGQLEKRITVPSNDPQSPSVSLALKVEMKQILDVSPGQLTVGSLRQGTITNLTVLVHRTDGKKLVISGAVPSSKMLRTRVEPVKGSDDQSANLIITVEGEGAPRPFNDNVRVMLEGVSQPAVIISVNGRLLGDVVLDYESLYWPIMGSSPLSAASSQALPTRQITVTSTRSDGPLEIANLSSTLTNMTVELVTIEKGKTYSVVAKLSETPKQSEQGAITFDTNTKVQPKITIPVTITVL